MSEALQELLTLIKAHDGINDKARLARTVADALRLTKDRSVYYCAHYAVRFSSSASRNFGRTTSEEASMGLILLGSSKGLPTLQRTSFVYSMFMRKSVLMATLPD